MPTYPYTDIISSHEIAYVLSKEIKPCHDFSKDPRSVHRAFLPHRCCFVTHPSRNPEDRPAEWVHSLID